MIYKQNFLNSVPYEAPSAKIHEILHRRPLCASTGNLNPDDYSDPGSAGGNTTEEDEGNLF